VRSGVVGGGVRGDALRLGMTYCRLLKWAWGDLERVEKGGDFVNCTLLDLFLVGFTYYKFVH